MDTEFHALLLARMAEGRLITRADMDQLELTESEAPKLPEF